MLINGYFVAGRPIKIKDGWVTPIQVERPAKQVELMTALLSVAAWDGKTKIKDLAAKFKNRYGAPLRQVFGFGFDRESELAALKAIRDEAEVYDPEGPDQPSVPATDPIVAPK